ncbi:4Fe-4S dicluster domain-containing protein [Ramlibacter alkalitolerans]|nr:4Fe-4S dicluster domain-containing protein [Ramlibacter alkalitolerans]
MEHPLPLVPALSRRRALALMAASLALGGAGCSRAPRERIYPWVRMPEAQAAGVPLHYASAFVRDGHALGVLVATEDGRPVKIEGNPEHPSSLGATDVFAQASVLQLWDPDRSQAVLQRLAPRAPLAVAGWDAFEAAWRTEAARLRARGGAGLRILTGPVSSPTLRAQLAQCLQQFPGARWHQHLPLADAATQAGGLAAFGREVQPVHHFDQARCVVAFAADPFAQGPGAVRCAMDWSAQRERAQLIAVEASPGLFGARADRRIALAPAAIDVLVARVAAAVERGAVAPDAEAFERALVQSLLAAGPQALALAGDGLGARSHALVHAINERLGAIGRTIAFIPPLATSAEAGTLAELVDAMRAGAVDTLWIFDANPVYDAAAELRVREALDRVAFTVHAGLYADETAQACGWHLPLAHGYEQWSDALAHEGSVTLVQPAIAPLYAGRSAHELMALLAGDAEREGHAILQRSWRARRGADFDALWPASLQRGLVPDTAARPLALRTPGIAALLAQPGAAAAPPLVALFAPDPSVHDGRFANNGWLQELPRPFTKHTWDNALLLGPETARGLALRTGDLVRASVGPHSVEAPVWVLAQHAEGMATLPLGYGRSAAGRVGNAIGFDAYALKPAGTAIAPLALQALGRRHDFAVTQHTMDAHGRELARTLPPGGRIDEPRQASLYAPPPAGNGPAWAMTIDLDACIGCNACTVACQAENNIPVVGREEVARGRAMHWIRVDRYETREVPGSLFQPVPCMHCEQAPCELVCPVGATMHDSEGLNVQVYNRCIGTRFCSNNCPYKVRRFNFLQYSDAITESLKGQRNPNVTVRQRGVMEKCSYCIQRIARARQHAQVAGTPPADGDVVTACQAACPTRAIVFGDLHAPGSAVAASRASPRHYALLGELNTRPRTTYLARVRREDAT